MRFVFLVLISFNLSASVILEQDWLSAYKITQKHPVYRSGEMILRPSGTFQLLFALHYFDQQGHAQQDCIWYKVPSIDSLGELRVTQGKTKCESWLENIRYKLEGVRSLNYAIEINQVSFQFTNNEAKLRSFKYRLPNLPRPQQKVLFDSSVMVREYNGVFFLSPQSSAEKIIGLPTPLQDQDCSLLDGSCQRCAEGVIKIYDADESRYRCGIDRCGEKGERACFRGGEWKKERVKPTCRMNPWHLYCQQGLSLQCEGELGFCR